MICKEVDTMYNLSRKNVAVADDSTNFTWDCTAIPVPVLLIYFNYLSQQKLHYGSML